MGRVSCLCLSLFKLKYLDMSRVGHILIMIPYVSSFLFSMNLDDKQIVEI